MIKNKLGVSGMIGYVLLIGIVMAIGTFMYVFLKSYVPADDLTCPDGAAISVLSYTCVENAAGTYDLNITLKNTGRFELIAYRIYATNGLDQEIATIDLSDNFVDGNVGAGIIPFPGISYGTDADPLLQSFEGITSKIYSIDITPSISINTEDNRKKTVVCGEARVREKITC